MIERLVWRLKRKRDGLGQNNITLATYQELTTRVAANASFCNHFSSLCYFLSKFVAGEHVLGWHGFKLAADLFIYN